MEQETLSINGHRTTLYFNGGRWDLPHILEQRRCFILTDETIYRKHRNYLKDVPIIVVKPGETNKNLAMVENIINQMISLRVNRTDMLIGWGGGVICDLTGFIAGIYKRGIDFAFIPTTVLSMVDAAVGGKNGVNLEGFKNMIGLIRQPEFIFYDYALLDTLPVEEWSSGFSEIIKHACILDKELFDYLRGHHLEEFQQDYSALNFLIKNNVKLKADVVREDESETGDRKKLNFGHTLGHAIERATGYRHGFSVAIGMIFACKVSQEECGFSGTEEVTALLNQYRLPIAASYDQKKALKAMHSDKKTDGDSVNFILLEEIGKSVIRSISFEQLGKYMGL